MRDERKGEKRGREEGEGDRRKGSCYGQNNCKKMQI